MRRRGDDVTRPDDNLTLSTRVTSSTRVDGYRTLILGLAMASSVLNGVMARIT